VVYNLHHMKFLNVRLQVAYRVVVCEFVDFLCVHFHILSIHFNFLCMKVFGEFIVQFLCDKYY
jgi:hypothetical protein